MRIVEQLMASTFGSLVGSTLVVSLLACSEAPGGVASAAGVGGNAVVGSGTSGATSTNTTGGAPTNAGGVPANGGSSALGGVAGVGGVVVSSGGTAGGAAPSNGGGGSGGAAGSLPLVKPRVTVLTDIANEPDDEESLVRFLVYANELDVEGLIATTSTYLRTAPREDLIRRQLDAYEKVRPTLEKHASGFPEAALLRGGTKTGQSTYGMAAVGSGKHSAGSDHLIAIVDREDVRPIWISVWGGSNTLAQALYDIRATRSANDVTAFVAKLRVYAISDQDDAGPWLRREFPELFYVVSPSNQGSSDYLRATWTGISGDRWYKNGPLYQFELVDNPWLKLNVIEGHGPLGALYPQLKYIMEGDTPAWLGLVDNGLGWSISPSYGGWGGRYVLKKPSAEPRAIWTNDNTTSRDTVTYGPGQTATSDQATIWRWRDHFQHDFAARMDWCVASDFGKANHNPVPTLNGDRGKAVLTLQAKSGSSVELSAEGTDDPDGDELSVKWWIYSEAGTLTSGAKLSASGGTTTAVQVPSVQEAGTVHVILQVEDDGAPPLVAYRRAVLHVTP